VYKVTAEGSGNFSRTQIINSGIPGIDHELHRNMSFNWKVDMPDVAFFGNGEGFPISGGGAAQGAVTGDATDETTIRGLDGNGNVVTTHGYCEAKGATVPVTSAIVKPDPQSADPNAPGAYMTITPFDSLEFQANCTGAIYGGSLPIAAEPIAGGFDQHFFLPREATRQGKIIQLVEASPLQRNHCAQADFMTQCSFDWHGTLTFEYKGNLGEGPITEDDLPDLPAGGGAQTPQTPSGPTPSSDDLDDLLVPLPSGKLSKSGDQATVSISCKANCAGTVSAYAAAAKRSRAIAAAVVKPLAKAKFKARAGKTVKVKLRFRGAAQKKIRKAGAVRLVIKAGGKTRTVVVRAR
jgi:hypothetical protein